MKIRLGFVSNSSGSSFILGVAKITDKKKFLEVIKKNDIKVNESFKEFNMISMSQIVEEGTEGFSSGSVEIVLKGNKVSFSNFARELTISQEELGWDDDLVVVGVSNDEGDSRFITDEDYLNFDIDLDSGYFSSNQLKLFELLDEKNGLSLVKKTFGAARNG